MTDDDDLIKIIHATIDGGDCPYDKPAWCSGHIRALRAIEQVRAAGWDFYSAAAVSSIIRERDEAERKRYRDPANPAVMTPLAHRESD